MDQGLSLTSNVVIVSEELNQTDIDWSSLVKQGILAIIIRLSHGITQDTMAQNNLVNAHAVGLLVHGYHEYEGLDGEVDFSLNNASKLGLPAGAYMFLKGAPDENSSAFANNWQSAGWLIGTTDSSDHYYRWKIADQEPTQYDLWQFDNWHAFDATGKLIITPVNPTPSNDSVIPGIPESGAYVDYGYDSTGLLGGKSLGYSTNGVNFYAVITPFGIIFRQPDLDRISQGLINKLKLQSPNGTVFSLNITDEGLLITTKEDDKNVKN
ncbi:hypothetical protein ABC418_09000 [Lactiplantibacillus plantarum]|uniref:hypothetical protein n=1 Tax=Lactiplantibacillus plantarum TaxID=1590 RepID=UPI003965C655